MPDRIEQFLSLSVELTGFSRLQLLGTAMTNVYLDTLDSRLPQGVFDDVLAAYDSLPEGEGREAAITADILTSPELGPVAQNVILLWYCGSWNALPDAWRVADGAARADEAGQVSAQAYLAALQWAVVGAHPPGSAPQGFGAWSLAPEKSVL